MIDFFTEEKIVQIFKQRKKIYKRSVFLPILSLLFDNLEQRNDCEYLYNNDNVEMILKQIFNDEEISVGDLKKELYPKIANGPYGDIYFCWPEQLNYVLELFCNYDEKDFFINSDDFQRVVCEYINKTWEGMFSKRDSIALARKYMNFYPREVFRQNCSINYALKARYCFLMNEIERVFAWSEYLHDEVKFKLFSGVLEEVTKSMSLGLNPVHHKVALCMKSLFEEEVLKLRENGHGKEIVENEIELKRKKQNTYFKNMNTLIMELSRLRCFERLFEKKIKVVKK